jgi:hypothetical protein
MIHDLTKITIVRGGYVTTHTLTVRPRGMWGGKGSEPLS